MELVKEESGRIVQSPETGDLTVTMSVEELGFIRDTLLKSWHHLRGPESKAKARKLGLHVDKIQEEISRQVQE